MSWGSCSVRPAQAGIQGCALHLPNTPGCSPRAGGDSRTSNRGRPMTRTFAPRRRGFKAAPVRNRVCPHVRPAQAGIQGRRCAWPRRGWRSPRAGGDSRQAPAGPSRLDPFAPRRRGFKDDGDSSRASRTFAPRRRGFKARMRRASDTCCVRPAHAGIQGCRNGPRC